MSPEFLLVAALLPLVSGVILLTDKRIYELKTMERFVSAVTVLTSVLVWALILTCPEEGFEVISFTKALTVRMRFDSLGRFFAGIVATLWPLTVLYAFEYMEHEGHLRMFYSFFTMAYGVTLGVAMAGNIFTMYLFYELLTITTVPLVAQPMTKKAIRAATTYFAFSLGGAAFAFAAMMFLVSNGATGDYTLGGLLSAYPYGKPYMTLIFFVLGFLGFSVKAAVFPSHIWLIKASVAPTPVTALLHAVAVVKSGAFAAIRLTYFAFGTALIRGTWAQTVVICFAAFTIVYGSSMAAKEPHWKRRLAYSTVANLSYILFGAALMSASGLAAALMHMAFHAEIKILSFFCAGAVLHHTGRQYVYDLDGLGRKMPYTFGTFAISALALAGIPPLSGFVSKWQLLLSAAEEATWASYLGAGMIIVSALLTAIYMFSVVVRAFFPDKNADVLSLEGEHEAGWKMLVPMLILSAGIVLTGIFAQGILNCAQNVAGIIGGGL